MGAPPEAIQALQQQLQARHDSATVAVWPEHWHAVTVFRLMATQWRRAVGLGGSQWLGLAYEALPVPLAAARGLVPPELRRPLHELLQQLQVLELHALDARNARA